MKRLFYSIISASILLLVSCEKDEIKQQDPQEEGFVLVGKSSLQTKTDFGTPGNSTIPFLWSKDDFITLVNNGTSYVSKNLANGGQTAEFQFTSGSVTPGDIVYYGSCGIEGTKCNVAVIPWQSGTVGNLHKNGDFGCATVGNDNTFTLEHYTSYLWLNTYSEEVDAKVKKIIITAENDLFGMAEFNFETKSFGSISAIDKDDPLLASTKTVEIEFLDKDLNNPEPKSLLAASSGEQIWAVAITFPATSGKLEVEYQFDNDKRASYSYKSRSLEAGHTYRISQEIKSTDLYELRTLTFEDTDAKFISYALDDGTPIETWSDLIDDAQYGGTITYNYGGITYYWRDQNNTELSHSFTTPYWGGGHVISNFVENDYTNLPDGKSGWYEVQMQIPIEAHSGSNFAVHNGYIDFFNQGIYDPVLQTISFSDSQERIIESIYITNTSYVLNSLTYGDGFAPAASESTYYRIVIYGYDKDDNETGSVEVTLCEGKDFLTEWEKVDLRSLGKVSKIGFNFTASDDLIGEYGLNTPAYFAYDDITVRF